MDDPYPQFSTKKDLFDRPSVRLILFVLVPGMVFALVSAAIRVSEYGIDHTILVFGDKTWVSGRPAAIRVSLMADDGRFFLPTKLTLFLKQNETRYQLFNDAVADRGQALGVNFEVPEVTAGAYTLELDIRFDERRRRIDIPITVAESPPEEALEIPKDTAEKALVDRVRKDGEILRVFTEDRGAPTGIGSTAFIRVTDPDGAPVSMPLSITANGDAPKTEESDRLGLLTLLLRPMGLGAPITSDGAVPYRGAHESGTDTSAADTDTDSGRGLDTDTADKGDAGQRKPPSATLYPNVVYSGVSLFVHTPLAAAGEKIKVTIEQVSKGGPIYANLFHDGRFIQAASGFLSDASAVMEIRPTTTGLHRLQVSGTAIGTGDGVAVRHFYVLGPNESPLDGLRTIVEKLRESDIDGPWARAVLDADLERGGFDPEKAAAFALSRLYAGHRHPPQLVSSRIEDDKELTAFKTKFQRMMMLAIIALGLGVACFIGLFALAAHKRQQRITALILAEGDDDDALQPEDWQSHTGVKSKSRILVQGAVLFFIVLGAFIAIALLVDTLTWRA